ncbi:signal transduction histidine kinase [Streptomyces sp. SAI-135]|nr:signal transduction histidine kinase [Streptomyces sp. SAI-090]MDH6549809.1 signal transduction histidine kinase [Streptomyces sp. SAI-041]MDH6586165.1 signal transduction histidine kinase [Streptomyces sp. SAI-133]MDH6618305.1 signal transduction histidine kinase [Streptomyces sp. SAI-135]
MPRVVGVTETGGRQLVTGRIRRWLHVLREDLCTLRVDPLPPSVWLRWLPHGVLCLVALGVSIGAVAQLGDNGGVGSSLAFAIGLAEGAAVVLAMWRPVPAWWLSTAAMLVGALEIRRHLLAGGAHGFTWPWNAAGLIGHLAVLLLLALRVPARVAVEALAVTLLLTYLVEGVLGAADFQPTGVLAAILFTVAVVLGAALRGRREARRALVEQTTLTAEERARRTLLEERSRIARELHDVVAHHMSVISIQAQVAPHLVENPSAELRENLDGIRENALEALTELRRVLGVLRAEHPGTSEEPADPATGTAPHAPQPTLDRLDALVENTRAAGLTVEVDVRGARRPLPPGVDLSAYRIVQEALSNVLRHAPGATASVSLVHYVHGVDVRVVNSRPTRSVPSSPGAGHGLLGMRERAAMLGGTLRAGPRPDGGYEVAAYLPTAPPAVPEQLTDSKDGTA